MDLIYRTMISISDSPNSNTWGVCKFPWLLANVLDPALGTDVALAGCPKTAMLKSSNGIKIGFIGLGEREW